jgi:hypothetical protein
MVVLRRFFFSVLFSSLYLSLFFFSSSSVSHGAGVVIDDWEERKWWSRGTVVLPTSAVVFLLLHSVAVVGGRWQLLCCFFFFSVVFPFSPLFSVLPLCFLFFPPSPKFCPPSFGFLPSGFYRQAERESPLPCSIMEQKGNKVTLPLQGKVVGRLQGMMPLSWQGMVVWVWFWQGFMQVGGRESEREEDFKSLLLPCLCIGRGEEYTQCRLKRHRVPNLFFF